jgi:hypothetical protein
MSNPARSDGTTAKTTQSVEVLRVRPCDHMMAMSLPNNGITRTIYDVDDPQVAALPVWEPPKQGSSQVRGNMAALTLTSIGELLAEPNELITWLVESRIPAGGIVVMAAKPKVGKSTTARDLALAIARGDQWLGHQCHSGAVWYLAFEGRRLDIREHFRQMGARTTDPIRVFVGQAPTDVIETLRRLAEEERPAAIIVDTMQRFLRAKCTDDYAEMTRLLDVVIGIAERSGASMILLHHSGKADRDSLDAVLGSTAITGSADTVVLLNRTARYRTISTVQRVGDDLPEMVIELDATSGRVRLGGSRLDAEQNGVAAAILAALNASGTLTEPQIARLVDARTTVQRRALRDLVMREQVSRVGRGGKGSPYLYSVAHSCSLVPSIEREQAIQESASAISSRSSVQDACSGVPAHARVPERRDASDCTVCGRDSCEDHLPRR